MTKKQEEVKDMVVQEQTFDLAAYGDDLKADMADALDNTKVALPRIGVKKDSTKFHFDEDDERKEIIGVMLQAPNKPRSLWPAEFGKGEEGDKPVCQSADGKFGSYGACETCPKNRFSKTFDGQKPECGIKLNCFVVLQDGDKFEAIPRQIVYGPTSIKHWQAFVTKNILAKNVPPTLAVIKFTLGMEKGKFGDYAVAKFEFVRLLKPDEYKRMKQMANTFSAAMAHNTDKGNEEMPQ